MKYTVPYFLTADLPVAERPAGLEQKNWFDSLDVKVRLVGKDGGDQFNLFYYGDLYDDSIVDTTDAPALIIARSVSSKEEILLYDGAIHGHAALFENTWDEDAIASRKADEPYTDKFGATQFQLIVWAGFGIDFEDEKDTFVLEDDPENVELINNDIIPFALVKQIGFDAFGILTINNQSQITAAVELELA
jgi:hypothetical protein